MGSDAPFLLLPFDIGWGLSIFASNLAPIFGLGHQSLDLDPGRPL
jgi:hypothetical protein